MSTLEALRDVLAVFEAAPSASAEPKTARGRGEAELVRVVASLPAEARSGLQVAAKEVEVALAAQVQRIAELSNDPTLARLVAERLAPSRIGELTPSDEALTAAFARGTAKAIAASHAAGIPVHAMSDGEIVKVPPPQK